MSCTSLTHVLALPSLMSQFFLPALTSTPSSTVCPNSSFIYVPEIPSTTSLISLHLCPSTPLTDVAVLPSSVIHLSPHPCPTSPLTHVLTLPSPVFQFSPQIHDFTLRLPTAFPFLLPFFPFPQYPVEQINFIG